ncbi:MAG TPA: hypothetical protein VJT71_01805, partial [Pyrinomonadaceae bacterium]|nr:hypothetical protein [Pyrinomonadaceae bacterium]
MTSRFSQNTSLMRLTLMLAVAVAWFSLATAVHSQPAAAPAASPSTTPTSSPSSGNGGSIGTGVHRVEVPAEKRQPVKIVKF